MRWSSFLEVALLCGTIFTPAASGAALPRDTDSAGSDQGLVSILSTVVEDLAINDTQITTTVSSIVSGIDDTQRKQNTKEDESVERAFQRLQSVFSSGKPDFLKLAREIVRIGLVPVDILSLLNGYLNQELNSINNQNPVLSNQIVYPTKAPGDAPYSVAEKALRAAIYIPSSFGYGKNGKKPVILVPGTATPAGTTYHFSFAKLGTAADVDVVWLNIPKASLNDIQINAEYVAYAINYISALTASNVAVISWSQGGPDTQWALKYWPTTRDVVDDFIAISPDFHGTVASSLACPLLKSLLCSPALWQQAWDSNFIRTLRANGGDSAYVPTTTIYSAFDEVVQPMSGSQASAILGDVRAVGVSNNQLQVVCGSRPAGGIYTHEGVLYNPLAWALAIDALTHDGPGDPSRLNLDEVCGRLLPPQLGLDDFLGTEGLLLVGLAEALTYIPKTWREPRIANYAA